MREMCSKCKGEIERMYFPMKEWGTSGPLCGRCYSAMIADFYPGDHTRMGLQGGAEGGKKGGGGRQEGGGGGGEYIQIDKPDGRRQC